MKRYYFDVRDRDGFAPDEVGLELPDIEAAQEEAAMPGEFGRCGKQVMTLA